MTIDLSVAPLQVNTVKVKVTPEQATKAEKGNRGIALLFH
jgi:hypothetical protein